MMPPSIRRHKTALTAALLCVAALAGGWAGGMVAHTVERRRAETELTQYANRLLKEGADINAEAKDSIAAVRGNGLPICSDADLAFMRNYVYNAAHVRDIARVRDNHLLCSTGIGRLDPPRWLDPPDVDTGRAHFTASSRLLISHQSKGFIISQDGVSVVLNPDVYRSLDQPPMFYGAWLHFARLGKTLHSFGHNMPLTDAELVGGKDFLKQGVLYRPRCDAISFVCIVVAEPEDALLQHNATVTPYFVGTGAVLGGLLLLIFLLIRRIHLSMESQLRRSVARGSLSVEFQPVVELASGRIVGAEALARWIDEDNMPIRPDIFIALAEEKGFISQITRLIARTALHEMRVPLAGGTFRVTVNVAAQDLHDPTFTTFLQERLTADRLLPGCLGLEITEHSTANHATAIAAIESFRETGYAVYLDDFGTGYSSLSYLHELEVDAIKIDPTFTQTIGTDAVTASVVPQILAIARELDLLVVVEGIETRRQADYFAASGVRILGQGYYFGRPMSAQELRERLEEQAEAGPSPLQAIN